MPFNSFVWRIAYKDKAAIKEMEMRVKTYLNYGKHFKGRTFFFFEKLA